MNPINKFSSGNGDKLSCLSGSLLNGTEFVLVATRKNLLKVNSFFLFSFFVLTGDALISVEQKIGELKETFVIDFSERSLEKAASVAALFATFFYK